MSCVEQDISLVHSFALLTQSRDILINTQNKFHIFRASMCYSVFHTREAPVWLIVMLACFLLTVWSLDTWIWQSIIESHKQYTQNVNSKEVIYKTTTQKFKDLTSQ